MNTFYRGYDDIAAFPTFKQSMVRKLQSEWKELEQMDKQVGNCKEGKRKSDHETYSVQADLTTSTLKTMCEMYNNKTPRSKNSNVSRWIRCPICSGKTRTKVYEDTVLLRFPLYCPKCKTEVKIDVLRFEMTKSKEPDA